MSEDAPIILTFEQLRKKLTKKERLFCHKYIVDWNASKAARDVGYSTKSCRTTGHKILTKGYVKQYISFIEKDVEKEAGVSKLMAIKQLKVWAFSSFDQINHTWLKRKEFEELEEGIKSAIQETDSKIRVEQYFEPGNPEPQFATVEYVKIKLVCKRGSLSDLAKLCGWNAAEKVEHSGMIEKRIGRVKVEKPNEDEK